MSFTKNKWKTTIIILVSLVIAVFFMWIALRDIDFNRVKYSLERVNYFWILISIFLGILASGSKVELIIRANGVSYW